jgi:hypothetical protein
MAQPKIAQAMLSNETLVEQGLLSRCLVAWPQSTAGLRNYAAVDFGADSAVQTYNERMDDLLKAKPPLVEGTLNELAPPSLILTNSAKALWVEFHDHIEQQVGDDGALAPIRGLASKAAEHVLRLGGVIAVVDSPETFIVNETHIQSAADLLEFYLGEALRLFESSMTDPDIVLAEKLLGWAQAQPDNYIYPVQIYQRGPNPIRDAKTARRIIGILEDHGWFIREAGGMELDGKPRREIWRVYR